MKKSVAHNKNTLQLQQVRFRPNTLEIANIPNINRNS